MVSKCHTMSGDDDCGKGWEEASVTGMLEMDRGGDVWAKT